MKTTTIEKISLWQLFLLILIFETGSSVVVGLGHEAKQDAWIAILLASIIGVALVWMFTYILSLEKGKTLFEIIEATLGKYIAIFLSFIYITYFLYIATRVTRDFMELLVTLIFPNTPIEILTLTFSILIIYSVYLGLEVLARSTEVFAPYIFLFLFLIIFFLVVGGNIVLDHIKPVYAEGLGPILDAIFPNLIGFPFGEIIAFTVFMSSTTNTHLVPKVSMIAIFLSGCLLSLFTAIKITVIGVPIAERATYPLLTTAREVAVAEFIERIDAFVVFIMMIGIFVKVAVFFFGSLKGLEYVFKVPYRYYCIPVGFFFSLITILIAQNYAEHINEGLQFTPLYLHIPLQIGIPVILAIIVAFKKRKSKPKSPITSEV